MTKIALFSEQGKITQRDQIAYILQRSTNLTFRHEKQLVRVTCLKSYLRAYDYTKQNEFHWKLIISIIITKMYII